MTQIQTIGMNVPVKTSAQGSSKNQTEEELTAAMFAGIMQDATSSQDNFFAGADKKTDTKDDVLGLVGNTDKKSDAKTNYEAMSSEKTKRPERVESKPVNEEKKADQTAAVKETSEKVVDEIKETYGVSDEEIENAMETLGLTMVDLLDTSKLASLVANLTDTDSVTALVADPTFTDLLASVNDMVGQLQKDQGIAPADFRQLLSEINEALQTQFREDNADILGETVTVDDAVDAGVVVENGTDVPVVETISDTNVIASGSQEAMTQNVASADKTVDEASKDVVTDKNVSADVNGVQIDRPIEGKEEAKDDSEGSERRNLSDGMRQQNVSGEKEETTVKVDTTTDDFAKVIHQDAHSDNHAAVTNQPAIGQPQVMTEVTPEVVAPQTTYTYEDIQNLMEQVNGAARAFATTDSHTIQMQLNPENLGRLFMSVTEKQGAVTAQISVTSEETRAALQTQLVELRANLENQGVKVEAVEVTVASHEFEQNLENQDATNREMMERQARKQNGTELGGRRNISMDNLDEMSGVMTEEERIVASMMQMNGQSVDYLA